MLKVAKVFLTSAALGFLLAVGLTVKLMSPREVRDQLCQGYAPNAKSSAEIRIEKADTNYLATKLRESKAASEASHALDGREARQNSARKHLARDNASSGKAKNLKSKKSRKKKSLTAAGTTRKPIASNALTRPHAELK